MIRLLFIGSNTFPLPILTRLGKSKDITIVGLVTNKYEPIPVTTPTYPVFTPENLSSMQSNILQQTKPDIILVCNYGQFLNAEILNYPEHGCVNIHASLLPKLRGACPVEMAIIKDLKKTGITIQKMAAEMDAGDIIFQKEVSIDPQETGGSLRKKLQVLATRHIETTLYDWVNGKITLKKQDKQKATYCYRKDISKDAARIQWSQTAELIGQKIRAYNPRPVAWTIMKIQDQKKRLKIFSSTITGENKCTESGQTVVEDETLFIQTKHGMIIPDTIQPEAKNKMNIQDFLRGIKSDIVFL